MPMSIEFEEKFMSLLTPSQNMLMISLAETYDPLVVAFFAFIYSRWQTFRISTLNSSLNGLFGQARAAS